MARATSVTLRITDPDGLLDAIATLEHIRDDAEHRIAALRARTMQSLEVEPEPYFRTQTCGVAVCNWSGPAGDFDAHPHRSF